MKCIVTAVIYFFQQIFVIIFSKFKTQESAEIDYDYEIYMRLYSDAYAEMLKDLEKDKEQRNTK
jgi:hypothetical protein